MPRNYALLREITEEQEAIFDAQADEQEVDEWLASWSDDFHSDGWADALAPTSADEEIAA
jgi:hypothetical protein